jgi:predicted histidine transporter YuiF (NhaC family)
MFACYACVVMCVVAVVVQVAFTQQYAVAFMTALAGFVMFIIARTLHTEWRQGKL